MTIVLIVLHVIVSLGLILVVLLQTGKGAEVGAVFGGVELHDFWQQRRWQFSNSSHDGHGNRIHGDIAVAGLCNS